jgi:hypothetical protein
MTQWLADEVLPATRPRLVVWGLSILDLNDNGPFHRDITDRYETAPARCRGPLRALFWLRVHSALVRRAGLLARPVHSARVLRRGDETRKPLSRLLGPMGKGLEYDHADSYRLSEQKREFIETQIVPDFSMGGRQVDALRRGVAVVQASGARLMFLEMPCGPEFRAMYPRGDSDVDQARDLLQRVAGEVGAGWLDPGSGELPLNWYADPVHLNGVGMARWTEEVGSALARAGEAPNPVAVVEEATSGVG